MSNVFIIAEAGVNHNGDIELAKKLVEKAAESGADAVKFQTFNSKKIVSRFAEKADYQKKTTDSGEGQLEMLQKLELSVEDHLVLKDHCKACGISFLSSPFDLESIDFLNDLEIGCFKIPSGEITNLPYLQKVGGFNKNTILSSGMSTLEEISDAVNILLKAGLDKSKLTILHCNTEYPTPMSDVNLLAIKTIEKELGVKVGYSDHTEGFEVSIAAVALGATVIEKHFTLDKGMGGPDHKASLDPVDLKNLVSAIRNIEVSLGDGVKTPSNSELKNIKAARKSIVAQKAISKGEIFSEENITVKRPGIGISPMRWDEVIGSKAVRDFGEDEIIEL